MSWPQRHTVMVVNDTSGESGPTATSDYHNETNPAMNSAYPRDYICLANVNV